MEKLCHVKMTFEVICGGRFLTAEKKVAIPKQNKLSLTSDGKG